LTIPALPIRDRPDPDKDLINNISRLEIQGYMTNTLLRDTDQMSMAHSLEVRVPFIDTEVVSYVLSLPGEWKLNGSRPKPLLLDAMKDLIPEEIWRRRKMGFTLPFERWMRSSLRSEVEATLQSELLKFGITSASQKVWLSFLGHPRKER